jgi:hypothetical protein
MIGVGPPLTEGFVDVGFGALIFMFGSVIWWLCKKQATLVYSTTTESELYAATDISKFIKWLHVLIADVGFPYHTAIVLGMMKDPSAFFAEL